jgi:hypothetical protein
MSDPAADHGIGLNGAESFGRQFQGTAHMTDIGLGPRHELRAVFNARQWKSQYRRVASAILAAWQP